MSTDPIETVETSRAVDTSLCARPDCHGCPVCAFEREYTDLAARVIGTHLAPARLVCADVNGTHGTKSGYIVRRRASGYLEIIAWREDASTLVSRRESAALGSFTWTTEAAARMGQAFARGES